MDPHSPAPTTLAELLRRLTPRLWVTPLVTATLVVGFAASTWLWGASPSAPNAEQLLQAGAAYFPLTVGQGQWWRLVTGPFVHAGVFHLLLNVWAFWNAGQLTERLFGNAAFAVVVLASALAANVLGLHLHPATVLVGFSGAVFGVYGALLAFLVRQRDQLPTGVVRALRGTTLSFLLLNVVVSATIPFVTWSMSVGGLSAGVVLGAVLARDLTQPRRDLGRRWVEALGVVLLILGGVALLLARSGADATAESPQAWTQQARVKATLADHAGAVLAYGKVLASQPDNLDARLGRATAHVALGHGLAAVADLHEAERVRAGAAPGSLWCEALALADDLDPALARCDAVRPAEGPFAQAQAQLHRAVLLARRGRFTEAHQAVDRALELTGPRNPRVGATRAQVLASQADREHVVALCEATAVALDAQALDACLWALRDVGAVPAGERLLARAAAVTTNAASDLELERALLLLGAGDGPRALALADARTGPSAALERAWVHVLAQDGVGALVALQGEPADAPLAASTRCWAQVLLGQLADAEQSCAQAVALLPGSDWDEGMAAFVRHDTREAARRWELVHSVDPRLAPFIAPWLAKARAAVELSPALDGGLP